MAAFLLKAASLSLAVWVAGAANATVELPFGTVSGNLLAASREFLGIPFAPKPARFTSARLWTRRFEGGHLEAKNYSAQCLQYFFPRIVKPAHARFSEDCLHLTIYTPREDRDRLGRPVPRTGEEGPWPVMLWIHGGGFVSGSAMATNYNASVLAARGRVVVVAANYRLGVLGFASVSAEEGAARTLSNQGFRDQRVAMSWVRRHIGAFGGDPARVTIFGESAGGDAVGIHVVSAGSAGLFDRAIMQSGGGFIGNVLSAEEARNGTDQIARQVGCLGTHDLSCLQQVPASKLLGAAAMSPPYGAVVDGDVLMASPVELVRRGSFNRVPFILGTMRDEGNGFIYSPAMNMKALNASVFECIMQTAFGSKASAILDTFRPAPDSDNRPQLSHFFTDAFFVCPTRKLAAALAEAGTAPWAYSFRRHPKCAFLEQSGFGDLPGAAHGDDVQYVFDNFQWLASDPPNSDFPGGTTCAPAREDLLLADEVVDLWAGFARQGEVAWPRFEVGAEWALQIDVGTILGPATEGDRGRRAECQALESLGVGGASVFDPVMLSLQPCGGGESPFEVAASPEQRDAGRASGLLFAALCCAGVLFLWASARRRAQAVRLRGSERRLLAAES